MAGRKEAFEDLNKSLASLGINGNTKDEKKKADNEDEEWSLGTTVAAGVGAGLALGAGIAALSYLFGGSGGEKDSPKTNPSSFMYPHAGSYDGDSSSNDDDDNGYQLQSAAVIAQGPKRKDAESRRRYGYFRCGSCGHRWESAYTYSKGRNHWYTQDCERCGTPTQPYRSEPIVCRHCGETNCTCDKDSWRGRHNNPNKPHHRDRCERCRLGLPCVDASYN